MNGTHLAGHHANAIGQTPAQCKVDEIRAKCAEQCTDHHNPQDGAQLGKHCSETDRQREARHLSRGL